VEGDPQSVECKYSVHGISMPHRIVVGGLCVVRFVFCCVLGWVGVVFFLGRQDYVGLLMDAVGLCFVIEIAEALYNQVLSAEVRQSFQNTEPVTVPMGRTWKVLWIRNAGKRDLMGLIFVLCIVVFCDWLHQAIIAKPLHTALRCTCLNDGDQCREAHAFDKAFWDKYWGEDVPKIFEDIGKIKADYCKNPADPAECSGIVSNALADPTNPADQVQSAGEAPANGEEPANDEVPAGDASSKAAKTTEKTPKVQQKDPLNSALAQVKSHAKNESTTLAEMTAVSKESMEDSEAQVTKTETKGGQQTSHKPERQEPHSFKKPRTQKHTQLNELKPLEQSIIQDSSEKFSNAVLKMQREVEALAVKSGNFLH